MLYCSSFRGTVWDTRDIPIGYTSFPFAPMAHCAVHTHQRPSSALVASRPPLAAPGWVVSWTLVPSPRCRALPCRHGVGFYLRTREMASARVSINSPGSCAQSPPAGPMRLGWWDLINSHSTTFSHLLAVVLVAPNHSCVPMNCLFGDGFVSALAVPTAIPRVLVVPRRPRSWPPPFPVLAPVRVAGALK